MKHKCINSNCCKTNKSHTNGKGSKPRPTNLKVYGENYEFIFRKKKSSQ